jgi:hypothetical protein
MTSTKYIGMDAHKESISIAVMNSVGKGIGWKRIAAEMGIGVGTIYRVAL